MLVCLPCGNPALASPPVPPALRVAPLTVGHPTAAATKGMTALLLLALRNTGKIKQRLQVKAQLNGSTRAIMVQVMSPASHSARLSKDHLQVQVGCVQAEVRLVPSSGTSQLLCGHVLAARIAALELSRGPMVHL